MNENEFRELAASRGVVDVEAFEAQIALKWAGRRLPPGIGSSLFGTVVQGFEPSPKRDVYWSWLATLLPAEGV